jgi:glycosyltransferase involved in cell wall biosynthesis
MMRGVTISIGYGQHHLPRAAELLHQHQVSVHLIAGGYPPRAASWALRATSRLGPARRLAEREIEVPRRHLTPIWTGEAVHQLGQAVARTTAPQWVWERLSSASLAIYQHRTAEILQRLPNPGDLYHYRSGFGGASLPVAKRRGMLLICDHSIAHPQVLHSLVHDTGRLPIQPAGRLNQFWQLVQDDLDAADRVIVNSDFVKETFIHIGFPADRVSVVYTVPDRSFLQHLASSPRRSGPELKVLYAGTVERRKGVETLADIIASVKPQNWHLTIAGDWTPEALPLREVINRSPNVTLLPKLSRADLARAMQAADVFLFPSLAEGSARVVAEAMATGCYIIATPNAGAPLADGIGGRLVPPGDSNSIRAILGELAEDPSSAREEGDRNAQLVRSMLTEDRYREGLVAAYSELLFR